MTKTIGVVICGERPDSETLRNSSDTKALPTYTVELPPGDWRMTKVLDRIVFVDITGQSPVMSVDKDGNWATIAPLHHALTDEEKSDMYWESNTRGDDDTNV